MKAVDVVKEMQALLKAMPEDMRFQDMSRFVTAFAHALHNYEEQAEADKLELEAMGQDHHKDARIQELSHKYGMTTNQVFGFMDSCDKLNNQALKGTGMVVVPFWFHEQYLELTKVNEALIAESGTLTETVKRLGDSTEDLSAYIPERQSIVTGLTTPYLPGVTGPRVGDEHMDPESLYPVK